MRPAALLLLLAAALALATPSRAARPGAVLQAQPGVTPELAASNATDADGAGLVLASSGHACGGGGTATRLVKLTVRAEGARVQRCGASVCPRAPKHAARAPAPASPPGRTRSAA